MQRIPTHIVGVELVRDIQSHRTDPSSANSRTESAHPFDETTEALLAFTTELSYAARSGVTRLLRCAEGEVFTAVADMRVGSPTFAHWQGFYLNSEDARSLFIPAGVACGWQVTSGMARFEQRTSRTTAAKIWRWLRWNDLELAVSWPEIPHQLAPHARPSRSLATLPTRLLPQYQTKPIGKVRSPNRSAATISRNDKEILSTQNAPQAVKTRISAYNEERILVIGSSGQLGQDLCRHLAKRGTVIGACRTPERGSLLPIPVQVDVSRPASIRQAIRRVKPTLIVNAAAMTDVELAEMEPRLAQMVNATAPAIIAEEAKQIGASVVHFCTNMVYGENADRPWRETDTSSPINQYGRTKLLGTEAVCRSGVPHLIIRAGWLYSVRGDNYVTKLVDLLTYRNSITLPEDQCGTPTSTDWLAETTCRILGKPRSNVGTWLEKNGGVYHVAPLGFANRLEVGDQIVAACRAHALPIVSSKLHGVPLQSTSSTVRQPTNCRLDCSKLALRFEISLPRWQQELVATVGELLGSSRHAHRSVA